MTYVAVTQLLYTAGGAEARSLLLSMLADSELVREGREKLGLVMGTLAREFRTNQVGSTIACLFVCLFVCLFSCHVGINIGCTEVCAL